MSQQTTPRDTNGNSPSQHVSKSRQSSLPEPIATTFLHPTSSNASSKGTTPSIREKAPGLRQIKDALAIYRDTIGVLPAALVNAKSLAAASEETESSKRQEALERLFDVLLKATETGSVSFTGISQGHSSHDLQSSELQAFTFGSRGAVGLDLTAGMDLSTEDTESRLMTPNPVAHTRRRIASVAAVDTQGYEMLNEYMILDEIGSGASGNVMLALHAKTQEPYAIKSVQKTKQLKFGRALPRFDIEKEVRVMKALRHRNVVALHEVIDDSEENTIYLVMEYVPYGPVVKLEEDASGNLTCTPLASDMLLSLARQIGEGLRYLHRRGVVHRDVKPDNILLGDENTIRIVDFGVSDFSSTEAAAVASGAQGTPAFFAPEVIRGDEMNNAGDVWSLGVTLFCMKFGYLPFRGTNTPNMCEKIIEDPLEIPEGCEPLWAEVFRGLLEKDPKKRISLQKFIRHPLFASLQPLTVSPANGGDDLAVPEAEIPEMVIEDPDGSTDSLVTRSDVRVTFFNERKAKEINRRRSEFGFQNDLEPLIPGFGAGGSTSPFLSRRGTVTNLGEGGRLLECPSSASLRTDSTASSNASRVNSRNNLQVVLPKALRNPSLNSNSDSSGGSAAA